MSKYSCNICNYSTYSMFNFSRHLLSKNTLIMIYSAILNIPANVGKNTRKIMVYGNIKKNVNTLNIFKIQKY